MLKELLEPKQLLVYIKSKIRDDEIYYVLLDEVQLFNGFEDLLNGLLYEKNVDVYVIGSNSKSLSKDVITKFGGRVDEIHLFPRSFDEFMQLYDETVIDGFREYMVYLLFV